VKKIEGSWICKSYEDIHYIYGKYGNALQAACSRGHKEVVQVLLEKGADVNAQGGKHGNALRAASSRGHKEVVQMLLENSAEPWENEDEGFHQQDGRVFSGTWLWRIWAMHWMRRWHHHLDNFCATCRRSKRRV
jgi:hypothetical protein